MCDQTEVIYAPGDVVWVKLGPVWWPSQVQDYDKLPADITANLRKRPIAIVKFFQEDAFEYVKNLDQIYHYNCRKKHEFIKKGLDMCRSSNRNVPSNMKMFPNDIATAEHLTHGDPDILNDPEFQPEKKEDYRELFGKKPAKKSKLEHTREWRIRSLGDSAFKRNTKNGRQSLPPRAVTHPRFINKALGKGSDHEVRIRSQSNDMLQSSGKLYNCHLCGFSASRINVIILHNKSHSAGYADAFLPSTPSGKSKKRSLNDKRPKTSMILDRSKSDEPPVKRKTLGGSAENKVQTQPSSKSQNESKDANLVSPSKNVSSPSAARKPIFGRKHSAKDKAEKAAKEKRQTEEFRENLLKDWDDEDDDNGSTGDKSDVVDQSADDKGDEGKTKTDDSKKTPTKETSCFDFDDSEDGIKPEETIMQFGRKIPRLLGDKRKRKSESEDRDDMEVDVEPKEILVSSEDKPMAELSNKEESIEERKHREENEKKAKEEFDMAFKALLEETVAPTIPEESFASNKDKVLLAETPVNTSSLIDDEIVPPDPPPEENEQNKSEVVDVVEEVECVATEDNQNFLVKMSGEEAATSPDKDISETKITFCDSNNVAHPNAENFDQAKELVAHVEEIVEQTTEVEEVVDFKVDESVVKTEEEDTKSLIPEGTPTDSSKCQGFLSNDFVDDCIVDNYCSIEQSAHQSSLKINKTPQLNNESNIIEIAEKPKKTASESESAGFSQGGDMQFIVVTSNANKTSNVVTSLSDTSLSVNTMYQDMDFDIDSMPVIIGDDMTQEEQLQPNQGPAFQSVETTVVPKKVQKKQSLLPMLSTKSSSKPVGNKVVTVISSSGQLSKMSQGELKQVKKTAVIKKDHSAQPTMVRIPTTMDNKITRKVILSPSKKLNSPIQSTAVRIAASTSQVGKLSVPGLVTQKGIVQNACGSGQVLILKSAGPSTSTASKALQKVPQMIQQAGGNKVLILTSTPGAAGQKVLGTLTAPQKTITGTRFLTTTKGSVVVGKAGGNTCQKILIDKSGAISQAPKSVIIDKASLSFGSALSKNSTALLTSSSNSIASLGTKLTPTGNSKAATTILASSSMAGKKGLILKPISCKGATVTDSQKLRLIASKSSSVSGTTGAKLVISSPQSRILVPSVATKNQPVKLITTTKAQPNSSNTILIQTNQGVLATSSFPGAVQNQTVISSKPQATLIATPKAQIIHAQNVFQTQNKKVVIPKKSASQPNILQKTQKKPAQRGAKKNFLADQTALLTAPSPVVSATTAAAVITTTTTTTTTTPATQDVLLLPSMKNMPVVSQGTILQGTTVDSEGRKSYVYLTVDEHGNYRPLETAPILDFDVAAASTSEQVSQEQQQTTSQPQLSEVTTAPSTIATSTSSASAHLPPSQQTLYFDPGTTDLDSLLLAIHEASNVVNLSQQPQTTVTPQTSTTDGGSASVVQHSGQDILAKALADTQVLQQEPAVTSSMLGCVFVESLPPAPSLAHNVLETSTTLNQTPIMTPLEMPSAVSSLQTNILPQIQSDFLKSNNTLVDPSMPLLSEDSTELTKSNKTIFVSASDSGTALLEQNGNPMAFQVSIGADNNIIVSSSAADIGSSLAAYITTHPSTSVAETILAQTDVATTFEHEEQSPSGQASTGVVEQQVETEVYPASFDMNDASQKAMDSSSSEYQESSSMEAKTDFDGGGAFNVATMSVSSSDYDLSISDSAKPVVIAEEQSADMNVQKLTFDSDRQR